MNPIVSSDDLVWHPNTYYVAGAVIRSQGAHFARITAGQSASTWAGDWTHWVPADTARGWSVKDFGATGDNATDDTTAIQAAVTAAHTFGRKLYFPDGNYVITSAFDVTVPMLIHGQSAAATSIINRNGASGIFTVHSDRVHFEDIYFQQQASIETVTTSQVKAIRYISGNAGTVRRCYFAGWYISATFEGCSNVIVRDNFFSRAVKYNLWLENSILPDSGDQVVSGNSFWLGGSYNTESHIYQVSAGGLRLVDNKVLQGQIGITLATRDGVGTSILVIVGNSFEYQSLSAIKLTNEGPSNTGTFCKVLVNGNQFSASLNTAPTINLVPPATGLLWSVRISDNIISGGTTTAIHAEAVDDLSIDANHFYTHSTGIEITSTVTNLHIGPTNTFTSVTTPISNAATSVTDTLLDQKYGKPVLGLSATAANPVNIVRIKSNAAGGAPSINANGNDTNIHLLLVPKGSNYVQIYSSATPTLSAAGPTADNDLNLLSTGTGKVKANGVEVVTLTGTQTLTNKTLTSPTINTATLATPTIDSIKGSDGNTAVSFNNATSQATYLEFKNTSGSSLELYARGTPSNLDIAVNPKGTGRFYVSVATGQTPTIGGVGADTNHDLNLTSKGTGVVKANGVQVDTISGAYTLTNKTLTSPKITSGNAPASAGATGTTGQVEWDSGYIYICTATNTWKRAAVATW